MALVPDVRRIAPILRVGLAVLGGLSVASVATAAVVELTACSQTVPRGGTGVLVADLDCPALQYGTYAVVLAQGARLELGGFTIRSVANGVYCLGSCRITGPGTIARTEPSCSEDVVIDSYGVFAGGPATLEQITFTSFGFATWASSRLRATSVAVDGQCVGLAGDTAMLSVRDSTITGNLGVGVGGSGIVRLVGSTVTGNLIDVVGGKKPRLLRTTCETSSGGPLGAPDAWGVCAAP